MLLTRKYIHHICIYIYVCRYHGEIRRICTKYWEKMARLAITTVEVKVNKSLLLHFISCLHTN